MATSFILHGESDVLVDTASVLLWSIFSPECLLGRPKELLAGTEEGIVELFGHVLTAFCFNFGVQFCKQTHGEAMASLLSFMVTNFYMVDLRRKH